MSKPNGRARKLMEHRQVLASDLPPFSEIVRGSLVTRYRRCGKPTCHCATGEGHGPAHYLAVTLKPGKTEQILLSEEMLPVARQSLGTVSGWRSQSPMTAMACRVNRNPGVAELTGK